MAHDIQMSEDSPHKRKRPLDDIGDREQKKVHIEDRRLGIENLHLDVGEKYLLCRTPYQPSRPQLSEDLFEMFGLAGLAAEVARVLPNGEKNAIRKTYKGHIKRLGVNGHFDSVKTNPDSPDGFLAMMKFPQEEWYIHHVKNKEIENGFSRETQAKLSRAASMAKGVVPKSVWDSTVLGELAPGLVGKGDKHSKATAPSTPSASATSAVPRLKPQNPAIQGAARPQRSLKKRSYGDSSYEGYGEGYPDDEAGGDTGYSTGEGEMGGPGPKRRKKNNAGGLPFPQVRQPSYGPGMVGA